MLDITFSTNLVLKALGLLVLFVFYLMIENHRKNHNETEAWTIVLISMILFAYITYINVIDIYFRDTVLTVYNLIAIKVSFIALTMYLTVSALLELVNYVDGTQKTMLIAKASSVVIITLTGLFVLTIILSKVN